MNVSLRLQDHTYFLESPGDAAKLVQSLRQQIEDLQKELKNLAAREKRAKYYANKLKEQNRLLTELEAKMEAFKGLYLTIKAMGLNIIENKCVHTSHCTLQH